MNLTTLPSGANLYRAENQCVVLKGFFVDDQGGALFSPDGKQFFELLITDRQGFTSEESMVYFDPHHEKAGTIQRHKDDKFIEVDGVTFGKCSIPDEIEIVSLPAQMPYPLPAQAQIFLSADHRAILCATHFKNMYSPDGKVFREIHKLGSGPCSDDNRLGNPFHFSFEDAHDGCQSYDVWWQKHLVLFGGVKIGQKRYVYPGNPDEGKPFVTIDARDFVLDQAALKRCGLPASDDFRLHMWRFPDKIRYIGNDLIFGGIEMYPVLARPSKVTYLRLPPMLRRPEYLFRGADGQYFYVSASKYNYSYDSFKLYTGKGKSLREIPVRQVERFRDGGTTIVHSADGKLCSPSPDERNKAATWLSQADYERFKAKADKHDWEQDKDLSEWHKLQDDLEACAVPLETLDPANFAITENEQGVNISSKS